MSRSEDNLGDLWNIKCNNIHIIGVPQEKRKDPRKYLKRIAENFPNMGKEAVTHV